MPDITMCRGGDCPKKRECYRYMAKPKPFWQSYAMFEYGLSVNEFICMGLMLIPQGADIEVKGDE